MLAEEKIEIKEHLYDPFGTFISYYDKDYNLKALYNGILIEHENESSYTIVDINKVVFDRVNSIARSGLKFE